MGDESSGLDINMNGEGVVQNSDNIDRPPQCTRGHWRPSEDEKLKLLVSQHGAQNWNLIAQQFKGRSGKSCRLRWFNQLDPHINRAAFTEEEEGRLLAAHRAYGNKWALIARMLPGRTDNAVKNHWHVIMARKCRQQLRSKFTRNQRAPPPPLFQKINERRKSLQTLRFGGRPFAFQAPMFLHEVTAATQEVHRQEVSFSTSTIAQTSRIRSACTLNSMTSHQQEQMKAVHDGAQQKMVHDCSDDKITEVPFIDFLGMGTL